MANADSRLHFTLLNNAYLIVPTRSESYCLTHVLAGNCTDWEFRFPFSMSNPTKMEYGVGVECSSIEMKHDSYRYHDKSALVNNCAFCRRNDNNVTCSAISSNTGTPPYSIHIHMVADAGVTGEMNEWEKKMLNDDVEICKSLISH